MTVATRRTAAVLVCAATALSLSAPAAHARELTLRDGTDDVWASSSDSQVFAPAPGARNADVTSIQIRHGAERVVLKAKLAELTKQGAMVSLFGQFRTNTGLRRDAMLSGQVGNRNGSVEFTRVGSSKSLRCAITHKIDYVRDTMMISIPRSCLNGPSYVAFRTQTSWLTDDTQKVYVDNPHDGNAEFKGWSSRIRRG